MHLGKEQASRTVAFLLLVTMLTVFLSTPSLAEINCVSLDFRIIGGKGELPTPLLRANCGNGKYIAGVTVPLAASPADGFSVYRWTGTDGEDAGAPTTSVTLDTDTVVGIHYIYDGDLTIPVFRGTPGGVALGPKRALTKSVIGTDDRIQISPTTGDPWYRNVQLEVTFPTGSGTCTGFFLSPVVIGTAGHCVYDTAEGNWATSIDIIPARNGTGVGSEPYGRQTSTDFWSVNGWTGSGLSAYDFGAVILPNESLSNHLNGNFYHLVSFGDSEIMGFIANISGYPGDKPEGTQWYSYSSVTSVGDKVSYEADTFGGQSGSAVYMIGSVPRRNVFAIHTNGVGSPGCNSGDNCGTRIRPEVADLYYFLGVPLFADNFESGDLSAWSAVVP